MKTVCAVGIVTLACAGAASAQIGRTFDWHTAGGDAQRSGLEHSDTKFTKDDVKDFKLVIKHKFEGGQKGGGFLTAPIVLGTLVSYKGFKELAFLADNTGDVWALDVDLDRLFWHRHIDFPNAKAKPDCQGTAVPEPTMEPGATIGSTAGRRRRAGAPSGGVEAFYRRIFAPRMVFVLGSDGRLYRLDTSTGLDMKPPVDFVPVGSQASNLNSAEGEVYTATGCGKAPNAVWASSEISSDQPKVTSFTFPDGPVGRSGVVIGTNDEVYVQTASGLQSLTKTDLKTQEKFSAALADTSPLSFVHKDRDLLVAAGKDGSLYLLDAKSLGTAVSQTPPLGTVVALATWETDDGDRWVLATVSGTVNAALKCCSMNGSAPNGSIVALKLVDQDGKLSLAPSWISRDLSGPQGPVIANGVVFALSTGFYKRGGKPSGHATLYALDGETGKEIYSTGDQVNAPANLAGLTIANGRVFFTTTDSTLYGFGYDLEH
jgi:PQQ-like domain